MLQKYNYYKRMEPLNSLRQFPPLLLQVVSNGGLSGRVCPPNDEMMVVLDSNVRGPMTTGRLLLVGTPHDLTSTTTSTTTKVVVLVAM
jgi:hypothetical protein